MSGEPKTLTLTLEETAVRVAEESDYLLARALDGWGLFKPTVLGWDSLARVWDEWEDAASFALGVPVVARDEAAELRAALRTLVTDLEALMEESHIELYDGDGALVGTSWGKVLQGGKDEVLSNWRDAKRLAGGENEK